MSATVAAALKKIAVAVLTNKKLRRVVLGIILGIIIIVMMPMVAILSIFSGDIDIDTDRLQDRICHDRKGLYGRKDKRGTSAVHPRPI